MEAAKRIPDGSVSDATGIYISDLLDAYVTVLHSNKLRKVKTCWLSHSQGLALGSQCQYILASSLPRQGYGFLHLPAAAHMPRQRLLAVAPSRPTREGSWNCVVLGDCHCSSTTSKCMPLLLDAHLLCLCCGMPLHIVCTAGSEGPTWQRPQTDTNMTSLV